MPGDAGLLVGGRYVLAEPVGQGGMGRVWRAHDQLLDRVVAVKEVVLPPKSPQEHADLVARTMREARAAARLDHPGMVTIHDVVEHDGAPWIVMQYVSGPSLGAEIASAGRVPWQRAAEIAAQVADALAHAHAAGIVHRDLKPDNILLSGDRVIVTDFGIARILDSTTRLTSTGMRIGTAHYMAPEQLEGGDAGPPADLWALGATLYAAVEGKPPFRGPTLTAVITAILTRDPDPPEHAGSLSELIAALMAKDPALRPGPVDVTRALAHGRSVPAEGPTASASIAVAPQEAVPGAPVSCPATAEASGLAAEVASLMPTQTAAQRASGAGLNSAPVHPSPPLRAPRRRRLTVISAAAVAVVLAAAGVAGWLAAGSGSPASSPLAWTAVQVPLPPDAAGGKALGGWLYDAACPATGSCVAVGGGYYLVGETNSVTFEPLIETLSDGTWTAAGNVLGAQVTGLFGVTCPGQGSCIAVGDDQAGQDERPVAATLSGGTWTAAGLPLPSDADRSTDAVAADVECPAPGMCIAAGTYADQSGDSQALIEMLSGGRWTAITAPLPVGAVPGQAKAPVTTSLRRAACPAVASCIAVGSYTERGGATAPLIDTLSDGKWTAESVALPADAVTKGQMAGLSGISCPALGDCLAVGYYTIPGGQARYLLETLSDGTWTAAAAPLPPGAAATQKWNQQQDSPSLGAVACQAAGSCVALGSYTASNGIASAAVDAQSGGAWTAATAPPPYGSKASRLNVSFLGAVCPVPRSCVAVGTYTAQDDGGWPIIETAAGGPG